MIGSRVIDAAPDGMIVIDASGTVLLYNAACERLFGYSAQEVLGNNVSMLMTPTDQEAHDAHLRHYLRTGVAKVVGGGRDVTGRRKDGSTVPLRLSVGVLRDDRDPSFFIGTLHDLTQAHRARARTEVQSELMQAARASAAGEVGAAFVHELTQPLAAVVGFVEASATLLRRGDGEIPAEVHEYMDQAVAQSLRAGAVVRLLREFTGKGDPKRSVQDINAVVEEACELAALGTAGDGVDLKLELELAANLPPVLIDRGQIQQVVLDLVRNSIDAVGESRTRTVTVATAPGNGSGMVEVVVADDGPGLPAKVRERVFEPFVSTKPDGIGIGLGICRTIVEAHGGTIALVPGTRRGTRFRFSVPRFDAPDAGTP